MNYNSYIYVTFRKEGIHRFPEAATNPAYADVSFLSFPHRHEFWFKVSLEVKHDNRDVEFILFKRELEALFDEKTLSLDFKSCEMIARDLATYIEDKYPDRRIMIEVSEDGENGAVLVTKM